MQSVSGVSIDGCKRGDVVGSVGDGGRASAELERCTADCGSPVVSGRALL
jgi:hypothetical protein